MRNYAHFELFWLSWTVIWPFLTISGDFCFVWHRNADVRCFDRKFRETTTKMSEIHCLAKIELLFQKIISIWYKRFIQITFVPIGQYLRSIFDSFHQKMNRRKVPNLESTLKEICWWPVFQKIKFTTSIRLEGLKIELRMRIICADYIAFVENLLFLPYREEKQNNDEKAKEMPPSFVNCDPIDAWR